MGRWLTFVGIAVALATAPRAVAQGDAPVAGGAGSGLTSAIGDPPRLELVSVLVRDPRLADPATARAVAEGLASRGGYAVAQGLMVLARHRDAAVRMAALRGIAEVGLRRADGLIWVRKALRDTEPLVRSAAFEAIGAVGEAADVPVLLEALASDDERTRLAGGRAITKLTGMNFPTEEVARWNDWWKTAKGWIPVQLDRALAKLEMGGEKSDVRDARVVLAQYVWFDVEKVQGIVAGWLRTMDARHRIEGYRALHACRLGDLADNLRRAAVDEDDPAALAIALRSAKRLGVAIDSITRSPETPALVALLDKAGDDAIDESDASLEAMVTRLVTRPEPVEGDAAKRGATNASFKGGGGGMGGAAVWLDLDAKKARWKAAATNEANIAADDSRPQPSSPVFWIWLGVGLVGTAGAAALIRTPLKLLRRSRADAPEEELLGPSEVKPAALWQGGKELTLNEALEQELENSGILPESLAAAGVRPREIDRLVDGARRWLAASREALAEHGLDHEPVFEATNGTLFDAATAGLSTESKAAMLRIRTNRAQRKLPIHFQVVEREEADWERISEALHREEFAQTHGSELSLADHSCLDAIRLDLPVRRARLNLNQLLGHVAAAWKEALKNVAPDVEASPLEHATPEESPMKAVTPA